MSWWSWFRRDSQHPNMRVVVYSRVGCHLCEDAVRELEAWRSRRGFQLAEVDVDQDPALAARFDACVPVVEVDGKVRMRGRFNAVLFQRLLDSDTFRV